MSEGTHKCLLHPDNPERKRYDGLGLPICLKNNLLAENVTTHMRTRHVREWAIISKDSS